MKVIVRFHTLCMLLLLLVFSASAQDDETKSEEKSSPFSSSTFSGLALRSIGPATTSGRVADLAIDPEKTHRYWVAAASGGVWKTENNGTTFTPVFDDQSSYSIGTVVLDPSDSSTIWVGTGENKSQRSVSYGDGVYKSTDGGASWKNMGLKQSGHISKIILDPDDSNVVYVAAQGPLWSSGGERGLYKSTNGGESWERILEIDEHTGVNDVVMDPRDPKVLYAAAHQRQRKVWTLINGGPGSGIYKSIDAGASWRKLSKGLPSGDLGRIGLAVAPSDPDMIYASVEAAEETGGVFRSTNRGATWSKRNGFDQTAFYYGEIIVDPLNSERIYLPNTFLMVSEDGGKTVTRLGESDKHVDNHALWINPKNTDHLLAGCDGGIYETYDRGATWDFKANLPITQFYDVTVDNALPFYNVYGGTQDNYTLGGPSRTRSASGITNADWFVVRGGDGFKAQVDPTDPNIVYAEAQYGALVRFDRRTGEQIGLKPNEAPGEEPLRWNWDAPLLISPHSPTRLYFAANQLFRSEDRGNSWTQISEELSRAIDPDTLEVMGRLWPPEAVAKGSGTSRYGNSTAMAESPLEEGLLYIGTDDGLLQITENGGEQWRRVETFPSVPEATYVTRLVASSHSPDRLYAAFDNHKNGDFKPYLLRSDDRGKNWTAIVEGFPDNGPVLALAEDSENPNLLFAGTEFGLFFTLDRGAKWVQLKGGIPTIAVRDLVIQARESDLVAATFGRGFYILDDYSPLRHLTEEALDQEAILFPPRVALQYVPARPLGNDGRGFQGSSFFLAENPPFGATFTYYLRDASKTRKQQRKDAEKKALKENQKIPYPTLEEFRTEMDEEKPSTTITIVDADGEVVRRLEGSAGKGIHRITWDLRRSASRVGQQSGVPVPAGVYRATLSRTVDGVTTTLSEPQTVTVENLAPEEAISSDRQELKVFLRQADRLQAALRAATGAADEGVKRLANLRQAVRGMSGDQPTWEERIDALEKSLEAELIELRGDRTALRYGTQPATSLSGRLGSILGGLRNSMSAPTQTQYRDFEIVANQFSTTLDNLRVLLETELVALESELDSAGGPVLPDRLPRWP